MQSRPKNQSQGSLQSGKPKSRDEPSGCGPGDPPASPQLKCSTASRLDSKRADGGAEAEAEFEEAGDRYEESVPGLGHEFLLEMRKRTLEVAEAPLTYPVFGGIADVRCPHAVGRFPHLIVFMVFKDDLPDWVHLSRELRHSYRNLSTADSLSQPV
jgi:hypothetical protein